MKFGNWDMRVVLMNQNQCLEGVAAEAAGVSDEEGKSFSCRAKGQMLHDHVVSTFLFRSDSSSFAYCGSLFLKIKHLLYNIV